jgi:hypothetical protein
MIPNDLMRQANAARLRGVSPAGIADLISRGRLRTYNVCRKRTSLLPSFSSSLRLSVSPSPTPYSPFPASSTFSSTTNQNTITPETRITPHSANAIANEPVKCAMKPVTIGASVAPTLPPKF